MGDIKGNAEKIIHHAHLAAKQNAQLIIFPELALTGYPPEDLLLRDDLYQQCEEALQKIQQETQGIDLLLGYPIKKRRKLFNAASLISQGKIVSTYFKQCLPNYSVFDEARYFTPGQVPFVIDYEGLPLGVLICEDLWHKQPTLNLVKRGAKLIVCMNASPFDLEKQEARSSLLKKRARQGKTPLLYVNCVGGQDELVFDGGSSSVTENGVITQRGAFFQEKLLPVELIYDQSMGKVEIQEADPAPTMSKEERIYRALLLGTRDYIKKNGFSGAIVGLSGGIDSALTLAIAVDALGADAVEAILMPSRYTASMSIEDALKQAETMNVKTSLISIDPIFEQFVSSLAVEFDQRRPDTTEQNLQARCRGTLLMAISNKKGKIVLATSNKSEMSVGYCTLYGDMAGGFSVLKDVSKTLVYKLARFRNRQKPVIPKRVLMREPSAELAFDQKDTDSLPPYSVLDQILRLYIEKDISVSGILKLGFQKEMVEKVVRMVDRNEYKRRQAAPGVRITSRAFGKDRRYPITSGVTTP